MPRSCAGSVYFAQWLFAGTGRALDPFATTSLHEILGLVRQPGFAARGAFIRWNLLGILDLLVAISIGTLSTLFAIGAPGEISTAPMATLPLLLIPGFLVPFFLMLHTTALMQSRRLIQVRA